MIKTIIFDFDGVIADSVQVKTKAFSQIYSPYGKDVVNKVVAHHLANGGVSRIEKFKLYHKIFLCKNLNNQQLENLAGKFSEMVVEKVINAPYVKGAYKFLSENHGKYNYFISSGTPESEIREIAKQRKIDNYFKGIFGSPNTKDEHVQKILRMYGFKKSEVVFVGDAPSDRDAAKINGTHFIARVTTKSSILDERLTIKDLTELEMSLKNFY